MVRFARPFCFLNPTVGKHFPLGDLDVRFLSPLKRREEDVAFTS